MYIVYRELNSKTANQQRYGISFVSEKRMLLENCRLLLTTIIPHQPTNSNYTDEILNNTSYDKKIK